MRAHQMDYPSPSCPSFLLGSHVRPHEASGMQTPASAESVKDVLGRCVRNVMRLDTKLPAKGVTKNEQDQSSEDLGANLGVDVFVAAQRGSFDPVPHHG